MTDTSNRIDATITHLNDKRDLRDQLPVEARDLITQAYNALIDAQGDADPEETHQALLYATRNVADYANRVGPAQADMIHVLIKPVDQLVDHLNYQINVGGDAA